MMNGAFRAVGLALLAAIGAACGEDVTGPEGDPTTLVSVQSVALHEGSISEPEVTGTWARSADGTTLTFAPANPLKPSTTYVIHVGGGMMDSQGNAIDLDMHGGVTGGRWGTQGMMSGGTNGMGAHMGSGWRHTNGSYGMVFTFVTGSA